MGAYDRPAVELRLLFLLSVLKALAARPPETSRVMDGLFRFSRDLIDLIDIHNALLSCSTS